VGEVSVRLHRVRRLVQLRSELHEIGIGTEGRHRTHLFRADLDYLRISRDVSTEIGTT
jgi:hypothetical protein